MKKLLGFWLILVLPFVLMACAIAPVDGVTPGEINEGQLYLLGLLSTGIVYVLKMAAQRVPGWTIKREWLTVGLFGVGLGLSVLWGGVSIPGFGEFGDPVGFVSAAFAFISNLLVAFGPVFAFATLIYNVLLKRVFDGWAGIGK